MLAVLCWNVRLAVPCCGGVPIAPLVGTTAVAPFFPTRVYVVGALQVPPSLLTNMRI